MADIQQIGQAIGGNITGAKPSDVLGNLIHGIRGWLTNETSPDPTAGPPTGKGFKVYEPKNASGVTPESYDPNLAKVQQILSSAQPGQGLLNLPTDKQLEGPLTDDEYAVLEKESSRGNDLAMQLLTAYKPQYGMSPTQTEQSLVKPEVNSIKGDQSLYDTLQSEQSAQDPTLGGNLSQIQSVAQQYSGISPQAPNAQTSAIMNQYMGQATSALAAITPVMDSALKDLGNAASISLRTFPYETLVSDLLNRYAYQLESPSYTPPPINMPGLPAGIQKLFEAATGTTIGGTNSGLALPGSGVSTPVAGTQPNLAPASNPSSTGG